MKGVFVVKGKHIFFLSIAIVGVLLTLLFISERDTVLIKNEIAAEPLMHYKQNQEDKYFHCSLLYDYDAFSVLINIDLEASEEDGIYVLETCSNVRAIFDGPDFFQWSENAFDIYINNEDTFTAQGSGYITVETNCLSQKDIQTLSSAGFLPTSQDASAFYKRVSFYEQLSVDT